jgi:uncharacterized membrane protein (UPF0182 family)
LETPYLQRNIALTREAYNLRQFTVKPFPAEQGLTFQSLDQNRATIDNIRLWDHQPLMDTYAQLQGIRTYYKFLDVDIDRYEIGRSYQQVTLSARELEPEQLPSNAQTWVNLHLLFTHGDGVVMSPVTRKSAEGLPIFYLQDIPPVASGGPAIREPRIYFGQGVDSYVIVNGTTPEFDYPKGKDNVYVTYKGADGVAVGGMIWRTLFAWYFDDLNILLTDYITSESKLIVYEFPKDKLVYGPFQIEARINQNTEISQQISLWNQMGSRVIRGHLLVVPIENSILYVSPLYLRAETGQLPELKRVIAAYGDRVVMKETLAEALAALFKESMPGLPSPGTPAPPNAASPANLRAQEALSHYDRAIARLKAGDWSGFGAELDALRPLLEELGQHPSLSEPRPVHSDD